MRDIDTKEALDLIKRSKNTDIDIAHIPSAYDASTKRKYFAALEQSLLADTKKNDLLLVCVKMPAQK